MFYLRVMSLPGLRKPDNFAGWDRSVMEKVKEMIISWSEEGGVWADQHEESDSFHLYDSQGNSLSDLLSQDLLMVGDVTPSSSQTESSGDIEAAAKVTLSFVAKKGRLWCHLGELAQLVQVDSTELVEALSQINLTVGPANRLPLRCLPELFQKMNVQDEIISEVTSQIQNIRRD